MNEIKYWEITTWGRGAWGGLKPYRISFRIIAPYIAGIDFIWEPTSYHKNGVRVKGGLLDISSPNYIVGCLKKMLPCNRSRYVIDGYDVGSQSVSVVSITAAKILSSLIMKLS